MRYCVYIMASMSRTLYVGVTSDLVRRVYEHREKLRQRAFTARYRAMMLVHFECTDSVPAAIAREKEIKGMRRDRKVALVEREKPRLARPRKGLVPRRTIADPSLRSG